MTARAAVRAALAAGALVLALPAGAAGGTLTVCTEAAPDGFDIAQTTSAVTVDAVGNTIYDQLLLYRRGSIERRPGLAERHELSADGLSLTLHLRAGVKFHTTPWFTPTREMNADDVMFSVRRLLDRDSPWRAAAPNGFVAWDSYGPAEQVRDIEKLGPMTVRLHLRRPNAPFIAMLAWTNVFSVFSAEYAEQLRRAGRPEALNTQPVGTGPYALRSYQKDAVLRLVAHPAYWGGAPKVGQLVLAITPDASVRIQRLKAGECLVGSNLRAETVSALEGSPVRAPGATALITGYIALNTKRPYLSDRRFREALRLAFDRKTFIESVYRGKALPAGSFLPPAMWSHDPSLAAAHDPERARALVKASGYDGREFVIATRIGGSIDGKRAAELMQQDWARIGVKVRVQMMEWGELLRRTGRGEHDITFLNWVGSGDPDGFLTPNLSCAALAGGNNRSQWCHKPFDEALDAARQTADRDRRIPQYRRAQAILHEEVPLIPTVYPTYFTGVHRRVQGFVDSPLADLEFRAVGVAPD